MRYYHVWIERKSTRQDEFRLDLTLGEVKERLTVPLREGVPIAITGTPIPTDDIRHLQVNLTTRPSHQLEPELRKFQSGQSALVGNSMNVLVANSGIEVTKRFIADWSATEDPRGRSASYDTLFDLLISNKIVSDSTRQLFNDGHYSRAVEEAFKCLNNTVKDKSGLSSRDGAPLMREAFSPNDPKIRLNQLASQSEKDEQQGYMDLFAGVMTGIRNPRVHETKLADDPDVALELLTLANHLMRKLASSETRTDLQKDLE